MHKLKFHSDSGHGWLAVKVKLIKELDIQESITGYSYIRGSTVYLEEDCDASLFIKTVKDKDLEFKIESSNSCPMRSPIRSYNSYSLARFNQSLNKNLKNNTSV